MIADILLIALAVGIVIIAPLAMAGHLNREFLKRFPQKRSYKYGYWFSIWAVLQGPGQIAKATNEGVAVVIAFVVFGALAWAFFQRQRWAWITLTILSCNPVFWIVNYLYLRNRWDEDRTVVAAPRQTVRFVRPNTARASWPVSAVAAVAILGPLAVIFGILALHGRQNLTALDLSTREQVAVSETLRADAEKKTEQLVEQIGKLQTAQLRYESAVDAFCSAHDDLADGVFRLGIILGNVGRTSKGVRSEPSRESVSALFADLAEMQSAYNKMAGDEAIAGKRKLKLQTAAIDLEKLSLSASAAAR